MITTFRPRPKTLKIAGHRLSLVAGRRYVAAMPTPDKHSTTFDLAVMDVTENPARFGAPAAVVTGLSYDTAKRLRGAFNEGGYDGRVW